MAEFILHPNAIDLAGQVFGKLTVTRPVGRKGGRVVWECRCDCGGVASVAASNLTTGNSTSCGCTRGEKHGQAKAGRPSAEYRTWRHLVERCCNPSCASFAHYGGRGIKVCDRWRNSFTAFFDDMGPKPTSKHSIDRIDVNGDYAPSNCRWATPKEQARNARSNRVVLVGEEWMPLSAACEQLGLDYFMVHSRLTKYGWSVDEALSTPPRQKRASK
jgi:hypothetical protein